VCTAPRAYCSKRSIARLGSAKIERCAGYREQSAVTQPSAAGSVALVMAAVTRMCPVLTRYRWTTRAVVSDSHPERRVCGRARWFRVQGVQRRRDTDFYEIEVPLSAAERHESVTFELRLISAARRRARSDPSQRPGRRALSVRRSDRGERRPLLCARG
jgi:hypothetical protein